MGEHHAAAPVSAWEVDDVGIGERTPVVRSLRAPALTLTHDTVPTGEEKALPIFPTVQGAARWQVSRQSLGRPQANVLAATGRRSRAIER